MTLAACLLVGSAAAPAQAAGLLDFLFGSSSSQQAQPQPVPSYGGNGSYGGSSYRGSGPYGASAPLRMRVQPRAFERRIVRDGSERAKKREARQRDTKVKLATPIDPKANPSWFLEDSTLRKGDILVLKGQVLVYEGKRGPSSIEDFSTLKDSKLVSKVERAQIESMAGLPANAPAVPVTPVAAAEPAPPKVASLGTAPSE